MSDAQTTDYPPAPAITDTQIGPDGRRKPFADLGVDPDAAVDQTGFAAGAGSADPTVIPPGEGSQIDGTDGRRKSFDELGVEAEAAVDAAGLAEGDGYATAPEPPAAEPPAEPPAAEPPAAPEPPAAEPPAGEPPAAEPATATTGEPPAAAPDADALAARAAELNIKGRTKMGPDELAQAVADAEAKQS